MNSIKDITLCIRQTGFVDKEEWGFVLKFPAEFDPSRTMILSFPEEGDTFKLVSAPNDRNNGEKEINYTSALDIFKEDVARIYSFDLDSLCDYLKKNRKEITSYAYEENVSYKYNGKEGWFKDLLLKLQKKYKETVKEAEKEFMGKLCAFFEQA